MCIGNNSKMKIKKMRENAILPKSINGNWMDVYASGIAVCTLEDVRKNGFKQDFIYEGHVDYYKGNVVIVKLGFALELEYGTTGYLLPRSSTFKNFGLLLTNSMGVIDTSYCGDNDEWTMMFYAVENGSMKIGERPGQMFIRRDVENFEFKEVEFLGNKDRGGYGSSGR